MLLKIDRAEDVLSLTLESPGFSVMKWVHHLRDNGRDFSIDAKFLLERAAAAIEPCPPRTIHHLKVLCGSRLANKERTVVAARVHDTGYAVTEPHPETAFLLCSSLSPQIMAEHGLDCLIVMHKPLRRLFFGGELRGLLDIQNCDGALEIGAFVKKQNYPLRPSTGFVFDTVPF